MLSLIKNLNIFFISRHELHLTIAKSQVVFFISSLFELTGILMLGPLILLATSGEASMANNEINFLYNFFSFSSFDNFFLFFFIATFGFILLGSFASVFSVILLSRISTDCGVNLGNKLLNHYIYQRWSYLMGASSNKIINEIYQESSRVTQNIFVPMMMMNKNFILAFFIICGLLFVDIFLTAAFFLLLSIIYIFIYLAFRSRLYQNSELLSEAHEHRLSFLNDVFELIKQIKIWGNEAFFVDGFSKASGKWGNSYKHNLNIALLPRYFVESFILLAISVLIFYSSSSGMNFSESFPKLSIFLFSAFKLLPALQGIYHSSSQVRGNIYALENIIKTLSTESPTAESNELLDRDNIHEIAFNDVSFKYQDSDTFSLKNISLTLSQNKIIGITGSSGSGKSTFCDILMGLLQQKSGDIIVNGEIASIYENKSWFQQISYAPPHTKLINDSIENNIFFAASDTHSIEYINSVINLDFIRDQENLRSLPTENNLSAGQSQRLGLARVFARKFPNLIILDEPTSALDNVNKIRFINHLSNLKQDKIIILITHELELLKELDQILIFNEGSIESFANFDEACKGSIELNKLIDPDQ